MKTQLPHFFFAAAATFLTLSPDASAQGQPDKKKGPTSKIYLAEVKGDTQISNHEKIYTARQGTAFDAPGTVIETKADAHSAFVYSNGTGMYVDQNSRVEINLFAQDSFQSGRNGNADTLVEPSMSQTNVFVARGSVGLCTSRLVSGSTMSYTTPQATMTIRNGKFSVEAKPDETIVDLLEGDLTVRANGKDLGTQVLQPGERAVIRPGPAGQPPSITVGPIPPALLAGLDERTSVACNARKTVTFNTIERKAAQGLDSASPSDDDAAAGAGQEIVARPTVPENLPTNITISADRLPGASE